MQIPQDVIDAIDERRWSIGETIRVMHTGCSDHKDPALSITRTLEGWLYHCFRCQTCAGFISAEKCTPDDILKQLEKLREIPEYDVVEAAQLPVDMIRLPPNDLHDHIPNAVYTWLWKFHVKLDVAYKYGLGWSPMYKRLVFPLYDTILTTGGDRGEKLLGWLGRDVISRTKEERRKLKCPKWLTQRSKHSKHFYYHLLGENESLVIVEDVVSAIRVHEASGFSTLALNTTFLPTSIIVKLKQYKTYMWLDGNMMQKMVDYVRKLSTLGVTCKMIHTPRDPKEYGSENILRILGGKHVD